MAQKISVSKLLELFNNLDGVEARNSLNAQYNKKDSAITVWYGPRGTSQIWVIQN